MDQGELKRVKEVIARADQLTNEIEKLREAVKVCRQTKAVRFIFEPFAIAVEEAVDVERLRNACSAHLLKDLAADFREAFVVIVEKRLSEREKQLEAVSV